MSENMQQTLFGIPDDQLTPAAGVQLSRLVSKPLLLHGDCRKFLFDGTIEPDSIDLTVTSPPYDNLRTYNGITWGWAEFSAVSAGLWRVTKPGGVVVWVVGDATIKFNESGTSFNQALQMQKVGFCLHDTMIWHKPNPMPTQHTRYEQAFEYMFVFSKGAPKSFNAIRHPTKSVGVVREKHRAVKDQDKNTGDGVYTVASTKISHNVWGIGVGGNSEPHPAQFPERIARDHIISWSNEGDTVFDPFLGSGTTGKMAKLLNRNFIGIEIDFEYYQIATKRIEDC